jgi:hypothetical protein
MDQEGLPVSTMAINLPLSTWSVANSKCGRDGHATFKIVSINFAFHTLQTVEPTVGTQTSKPPNPQLSSYTPI